MNVYDIVDVAEALTLVRNVAPTASNIFNHESPTCIFFICYTKKTSHLVFFRNTIVLITFLSVWFVLFDL